MDDARAACLGFSLCGGIGPVTLFRLQNAFGSVERAFHTDGALLSNYLRDKQLAIFLNFRKEYSYTTALKILGKKNVWVITLEDSAYPKQLRNIKDPPICIFGKGDKDSIDFESDRIIGVVGARKPTEYGCNVAQWCGELYAQNDYVIVSGLAYGVDSIAQQSAINNNGRTIAVLGTDICSPYPSQNEDLYTRIIEGNGIIISEHPPGFFTTKGSFVLRNRIIVGLSESIVVVEGGEHSGSLISARYAAENGRDVFAVPGHITSEMSVGPHILLRQGAQLLQHPLDVIDVRESQPLLKKMNTNTLTPEETKIIEILSNQPVGPDAIVKLTSGTPTSILALLSMLEIRGLVRKTQDGCYVIQ